MVLLFLEHLKLFQDIVIMCILMNIVITYFYAHNFDYKKVKLGKLCIEILNSVPIVIVNYDYTFRRISFYLIKSISPCLGNHFLLMIDISCLE